MTNPAVPPPGLRINAHATAGGGRSLNATRHFAPGSEIATFSSPLLAIPDGPRALTLCNWCLGQSIGPSATVSVSACTGCRSVAYCSKPCQTTAWREGHKLECGPLRKVRERVGKANAPIPWLPSSTRAVMLLLLKLKKGDEAVKAAIGDIFGGEDEAGTLEGNVESFKEDEEEWTDIRTQTTVAAMYAGFKELTQVPGRVMELLCKISTNAFDELDPDIGSGGIFLDPVLAMANHSCIPNAFVCFSGRTAILRAEKEIGEGDEIEISYTDFNLSKEERQKALKHYHFECQCPRCVDDLDVYQVCQRSPLVPMNRLSLMPDLQKLLNPPIDRALFQRRASGSSALQKVGSASPAEEGPEDPQEKAKRQWELCKPLLEAKMFAVEPVPTVIQNLVNSYQANRNFPLALSLSCFLATECHPYAHVAPFKAWRVKGMMMMAGLLTHTAPLLATGELAEVCPHKELVEALSNCDAVSTCELLSRLALHYGPMAHSEEWGMLNIARELLGDIEYLQGREQESSLIRAWVADPQNHNGKILFEEGILKPIKEVASFAIGIVTAEFENDGKAVATRRG